MPDPIPSDADAGYFACYDLSIIRLEFAGRSEMNRSKRDLATYWTVMIALFLIALCSVFVR